MREPSDPRAMDTTDLVKELAADSSLLVKRQLELAKLEVENDVRQRISIFETFGIFGLMAYGALLMLLVAAASALSTGLGLGLWSGALVVAAILVTPAALVAAIGYRKLGHKDQLLRRSKQELDKEVAFSRTLSTIQ
jgi:hypothetical protein